MRSKSSRSKSGKSRSGKSKSGKSKGRKETYIFKVGNKWVSGRGTDVKAAIRHYFSGEEKTSGKVTFGVTDYVVGLTPRGRLSVRKA